MEFSIDKNGTTCQLRGDSFSQVVKRYLDSGTVVVRNAVIRKVRIGLHAGDLTVYVELGYHVAGQSFGGITYIDERAEDCTGVLIYLLLLVTGVSELKKVVGQTVRAIIVGNTVVALAHIVDDGCVFDKQNAIDAYLAQVAAKHKLHANQ